MEPEEIIQSNQSQEPGKIAPNIPGKLVAIKNDLDIKFENDFGKAPIALGRMMSSPRDITIATLVGAFVGAATGGIPLAGAILAAGLNDVLFVQRKDEQRKDEIEQPEPRRVEQPTVEVLPSSDVLIPAVQTDKVCDVNSQRPGRSVQNQHPESLDLALELASTPKSTIIAASPRVGKGMVVTQAIAHIKRLHPNLEIWLIDPKNDPSEQGYWSALDSQKRCHYDLRDFDVDANEAIDQFSDLISRFNASRSDQKLLIIDEFVTLSQVCNGTFLDKLRNFIVATCSSGEVGENQGAGKFIWLITQSPYTSDLGFKTKAATSVFQRVLLLNKATIQLYQLAVNASYIPGGMEDKINRALGETGRAFYHTRFGKWFPIPNYQVPLPQPVKTSNVETVERLEELFNAPPARETEIKDNNLDLSTEAGKIQFVVEVVEEYLDEKGLEYDSVRNIYNGKNRIKAKLKSVTTFTEIIKKAAEQEKLRYSDNSTGKKVGYSDSMDFPE